MPDPDVKQLGQFQFLHLKSVEVDVKNKRPKYPVKIKLIRSSSRSEPPSKEFGDENNDADKKDLLVWDVDTHLSPSDEIEISIKESHTMRFLSKKDFASVKFEAKEIGKRDTVVKKDEETQISVKLTFASLAPAGNVMRKEAQGAEKQLDKKSLPLQKLGRARSFIDAAKKFAVFVSEIHPIAKAAVIAFEILYEKLEEQETIHDDAAELLEDLQLFLPFTEVIDPEKVSSEAAKSAIADFLNLFKETCEFVVQFSSSGIIGDLISSQKPKISRLEREFRKVKSRYDWSIKTDVWRATLKLEKYHDDEILRLLQVSLTGAAGKERHRSDRCCLPGTRSALLDQISQWAENEKDSKLFWLHGIAGSGKSAIANTIATSFESQSLLAGCFFCKRDDPDLRNPDKVIPSLAFHLSVWHQPYSAKLLAVLQGEKHKLASKTIQEQFELLIKGPALELSEDERVQSPRPLLVVVDALDECGVTKGQRSHLAQVLVQVAMLVPWLKLVVTSRPLTELMQAFQAAGDALRKLHLNEAGDPTADILLYTTHRAKLVADEFSLEPTWLSEEQVTTFTRKAQGLFIWTSTVFNFIDSQFDPNHAVAIIFSASPEREDDNPEAALDDVYRMVLHEAGKSGAHDMLLVKTIAGVIFSTARNVPLPVDAISKLIPQFNEKVIGRVVDRLQAVLYKDIEQQNSIRVCHPSFIDFMSLESRSIQFWTQPSDIDLKLASRCFEIMKEGLSFNICRLETSHLANEDIPDLQRRIATEVSRALSYSCLYWMTHVEGADPGRQGGLSELTSGILCNEIALYWLEVLSLLGELRKGIRILSQASITLTDSDLKAMALELFRFVSAFHDAMSTSTPHLYLSALAWLPTDCLLAQKVVDKFGDRMPVKNGKTIQWPNTLLTIPERSLVVAVAYSRDGRHIATGRQDGVVSIRDAQTGNLVGPPLRGFAGMITSVAFSPDGKLVAASTNDNTIRAWDVETGVPTLEPIRLDARATCIAFTPDGRNLVSGSEDSTIHIWEVETGKLVNEPIKGGMGSIRAIAVSPEDGRYIASGSELRIIQVWDTKTGQLVGKPLKGHGNWVSTLSFSPDGKYLASGSYDKTIRVWDPLTGDLIHGPFTGHTDYIYSIDYSPKGDLIVSGSSDTTIRVWSLQTGKQVGEPLRGHTDWVVDIAISPDGRYIVSGSHDKSTRIWDLESNSFGEELLRGQPTSVAFSPDGTRLACGTTGNAIQLWDAETGKTIGKPLEGHSRSVNAIAFSKDGKFLVSGSDDKTARVWDTGTQSSVGDPLVGHEGWVKSVAFSEDRSKIVSGSQDKTVRIWDVATHKQVGEALSESSDWINTIALSPDGQHVASGADDSTILIWDMKTGELEGEPLAGHGAATDCIAYSPDGSSIAAGFHDGTIRIWSVELDMRIIVFDYIGTSGPVRSVAFSPDGTRLVTGSDDGIIEIWDTRSGETIGEPLTGHTDRVTSVTYSPEGSHIVSSSEDGTIRVWETERRPNAQIAGVDWVPPSFIPRDGWIRGSEGELLLWVPLEYRNGVCDMSSLCIPSYALGHLVRIDWDNLCHGASWTKIRRA